MSQSKRHKLDATVATLQQRYHLQTLRQASDLSPSSKSGRIPSGFPQLDAITGCGGIPLGAITLLNGRSMDGCLPLAYQILANAQQGTRPTRLPDTVALLDLNHTADPAALQRCGLNLDALLLIRPHPNQPAVDLLLDLVHSRQFCLILVDSLAALGAEGDACRRLNARLPQLHQLLRMTGCGLLLVDRPYPAWQRWLNLDRPWLVRHYAALHLTLQRTHWRVQAGAIVGYMVRIRLLKSHWAPNPLETIIEIDLAGVSKT
jgi:hypothetical protein